MPIKFSCPHCKRGLSVKEHLAGKRAACPACKEMLTIPAPVSQPADVEEFAAAALGEKPAAAEPAKPVGTIDFICPMCDEPAKAPADLAGKQMPCPSCKRIVKVPLPEQKGPKDWRTIDTRMPSAARRDDGPAPEGAWGTAAASNVSRQSLVEANVLPDTTAVLTPQQKLKYGAALGVVVLLLGAVGVWGWNSWSRGLRNRALATALQYVADDKVKSAEGAAEVHRAAGEYYLREGKAEEARTQFDRARARFAGDSGGSPERDCMLIDLALAQAELGGTREEVVEGTRLDWKAVTDEVRQTLQKVQSTEALREAIRQMSRKLIARGRNGEALALASAVTAGTEAAEGLALVGLELLRTDQAALAGQLADQAAQVAGAPKPKTPEGKQAPFTPSVLALCLALDKPDKAKLVAAEPKPAEEIELTARVGYAEGWARKGIWDRARALAGSGPPADRVQVHAALAEAALDANQPDNARQDLEAAAGLLEGELKGRPLSPWLQLRLVQLANRGGLHELAQRLAGLVNDPALKGRAQLELLRGQLATAPGQVDSAQADAVGKESPAYPLALEALTRHNARTGSAGQVRKAVATLEPEQLRAFGYLGLALGLQDSGQ